MARYSSQFLLKLEELNEQEKQDIHKLEIEEEEEEEKIEQEEEAEDVDEESGDEITECFKCMNLHDYFTRRAGGKLYGQWKQEQRLRATRMELHLNEKWSLEHLIEEQLSRFDYNHAQLCPSIRHLNDVPQLLIPKCRLPLEMATLAWLGNWRPSAILTLLNSFTRSSSSSSSSRRKSGDRGWVVSQLIRETRIEEAVLDQEMAEIQATCILHLQYFSSSPNNNNSNNNINGGIDLSCVRSEFKKIDRVITQAQKLRYKTLEVVVKKLLDKTKAAEFLVAFAGIQAMVHEFAACRKQQKGPISVTIKTFRDIGRD